MFPCLSVTGQGAWGVDRSSCSQLRLIFACQQDICSAAWHQIRATGWVGIPHGAAVRPQGRDRAMVWILEGCCDTALQRTSAHVKFANHPDEAEVLPVPIHFPEPSQTVSLLITHLQDAKSCPGRGSRRRLDAPHSKGRL